MKKEILYRFQKKIYPQFFFAKAILKHIPLNPKKSTILFDAPCGIGITTWHLASIPRSTVYGYDIDEKEIHNARAFFQRPNIEYKTEDLAKLDAPLNSVDYFCLINSLFLLKDVELILKQVFDCLKPQGKFFVIIPNIGSKNYLSFKVKNPNFNLLEFSLKETIAFLEKHEFKILATEGICFTSFHDSKNKYRLMLLSPFFAKFMNFFSKKIASSFPSYYLLVFSK